MKVMSSSSFASKQSANQSDDKNIALVAKSNGNMLSICVFACLTMVTFWQVYLSHKIYYTFPTNFVMESTFDSLSVTLPAMTFCTNIGDMTANRSDQAFQQWKAEDMVLDMSFVSEDGQRRSEITKNYIPYVRQSISYKYYCFTINSKLEVPQQLQLRTDDHLHIQLSSAGIFGTWWIFMHNSFDIPSSYQWDNTLELKKGSNIITYSHQSYRLNEKSKKCQNYYSESEYNSRSDCIRKCKIRQTIFECGVIHNGIDIRSGEPSVRFAKTSAEKTCVNYKDLTPICHYMCPKVDCVKDYYQPEKIIVNEGSVDYVFIQLVAPKEPQTTYNQRPVIESNEMIYFWISTLSLWFVLLLCLVFRWAGVENIGFVVFKDKLNMIQSKIHHKFDNKGNQEENQKI